MRGIRAVKMSATVPPSGCCQPNPCDNPQVTQVPGPAGANGLNAFSVTTAAFTMPLPIGTANVSVKDTSWMVPGQILFVQTAGYMNVQTITNATTAVLENTGAFGNSMFGTNIPSGSGVTPGGAEGAAPGLNSLSPTTTKGDLIVDNGANSPSASDVRLAAGTNFQLLHSDDTTGTGLRWGSVDLSGANSSISGTLPLSLGGTGGATQAAALSNLLPGGAIIGDLIYYNGTNWVYLVAATTVHMQLRSKSGTPPTIPEWAFQGLLQKIVKLFAASSGVTTTTGLAFGSTAPTTATGALAFTQAVTPVSTLSALKVEVNLTITTIAGAYMALFNGTTLLAVVATSVIGTQQIRLVHEFTPGSLTPLTLNVYVGNNGSTNAVYVGGTAANGANFYGSTTNLGALTIEEMLGV